MFLNNLSLAAKLFILPLFATFGFVANIWMAQVGSGDMAEKAEKILFQSKQLSEESRLISSDIENAISLVRAAPSILDLDSLATSRAEFEEVLGDLLLMFPQSAQETSAEGVSDLDKLLATGIEVFEFAGQFAQKQAIAKLDGEFEPAAIAVLNRVEAFRLGGIAEAEALLADLKSAKEETNRMILVSGIVALISVGSIGLLIARNLSRRMNQIQIQMSNLADGDLEVEIIGVQARDELGKMAKALQIFRQTMIEKSELSEREAAREANEREASMEAEKRARAKEEEQRLEKEKANREVAEEREAMMQNLSKSFGTVVEAAIEGEFSKRVEAKFSDQILNKLAENINQLLGAVEDGLSETGRVLERVAHGDLTKRMEGDFRGAFGHLQSNVNEMIGGLNSLIVEISGSGITLVSSSAELRDTSDALSKEAEKNAASLEETSAALDQLSASVKVISRNVSTASEDAKTARNTAESSEKVATDAAASMQSISAASKEITHVVGVIDDIAFQINLLALNAGVEAARAGEAGRGFSVVASEVRQLAQRAAEASKEIAAVIAKSDAAVSEGVEKVAGAQSSLEAIAQNVIDISNGVNEASAAICEQEIGINEITSAISQIDRTTQKQAASFEEVTAASAVLASEADKLKKSTARFRTAQSSDVLPMTKPERVAPETRFKVAAAGGAGQVTHEGWDEF